MRIGRFVLAALIAWSSVARAQPSWPEGAWVRGQHVLIQFTGVLRASPGMHRTKEEARRRAMEVIARVLAGEPFDALVKEYSDDPATAASGGDLGLIAPGVLAPELEQTLLELKEGEVSKTPVQTVFGFHVVRRLPSEKRLVIRHILVAYTGAVRAKVGLKRTREQARGRAAEIVTMLASGESFEALAKAMSDDPATAAEGGLLGELRAGVAVPAFEAAANALEPGDTSPVIETPFGFHILHRDSAR